MVIKAAISSALVVVLAVCLAAPVSADVISLSGGTYDDFPDSNNNDFLAKDAVKGTYGADLTLDEKSSVIFTFINFEAGWANSFLADTNNDGDLTDAGDILFTTGTMSFPTSATVLMDGGTMDFGFHSNKGTSSTTDDLTVNNGFNVDDSGGAAGVDEMNWVVVVVGTGGLTGRNNFFLSEGTYLFLDDTGAGDDDNHDDMIIKVQAVPEPGTLALFGALGLVGLAVGRRRRRLAS